MIEFPRDPQNSIPTSSVKIIGLGGAGANMLDRVALDGLEGAEMLALNTDIRTLSGSVASERVQLGRNLTKGLGTGGDPQLGLQAVQEAEDEIRASIKSRKIVFICVGLGGGTGSGAAPLVARIAREEGAFVVMFATMPFAFEGSRRREQAETALNELAVLSNALVTFDNGRMGELVLAKQGIHEAFAAADRMISESIKAVIRLVVRPGLINVGLDELMTALRTTRSRCLFGSGIARGKDRAQKALRNALASPLLDQGALLKEAQSVLVHLCGGEDLTLFEIELLMESMSKHVPESAQVLFGAAVDPSMGDQLSITLVSSLPEDRIRARSGLAVPEEKVTETLEPSVGFDEPAEKPKRASRKKKVVADEWAEPEPEETELLLTEEEDPEPAPEAVEEEPGFEAELEVEEEVVDEVEVEPEDDIPTEEEPVEQPVEEVPEEPEETIEEEPEQVVMEIEEFDPDADLDLGESTSDKIDIVSRDSDLFVEPASRPAEVADDEEPPFAEAAPAEEEPDKPSKPKRSYAKKSGDLFGGSGGKSQSELSLDGAPKGRFEGADPSLMDGEDLDVPAFLRKKRK